jgi:hypothetical protein
VNDGTGLDPAPPLPRQDVLTDLQLARMLARVIVLAARRLELPFDKEVGLDTLCRAILQAARAGGLDAGTYRLIWWVLHGPERIACIEP